MIRVGTAGWSIASAFRSAFPGEGMNLERYARVLPCVEINSSFHRPHRREVYGNWARQTPRSFRFAVKLPREITHEGRLRASRRALAAFLEQAGGLGSRLGPLLVQLPPSLPFEARAARRFFVLLREMHARELVCEPRHPSWFGAAAHRLLGSLRVGRVAADPAVVPAAMEPAGDLATVYFRLHGSPRMYWSPYTPEQLAGRAVELRRWSRHAHVWCLFDNTAANAALANALELNRAVRGARPTSAYGPSHR